MNAYLTAVNPRLYTPVNALQAHAERMQSQSLSDLMGSDSTAAVERASALVLTLGTLHLDLSKQRINQDTLSLLTDWAQSCGIEEKRQKLFAGAKVNTSERRAALHMAARWPASATPPKGMQDAAAFCQQQRIRLAAMVECLHQREWFGATGQSITDEIILVTRSGKAAIEDHFDAHTELEDSLANKGKDALLETLAAIAPPELKITSVRQANAQGLGHAVFCAAHLLSNDEPFAVILPDVLVKPQAGSNTCDLGDMVTRWDSSSASQIMVEAVPEEEVYRYGIVDCGGNEPSAGESANMRGVVEKPKPEDAPSRLSVIGRYVLPYRVMELLKDQSPGAGNEIQLTDAIDRLMHEGSTVQAFRMNGRTFDCGHIEGWLKANTILAREAGYDI